MGAGCSGHDKGLPDEGASEKDRSGSERPGVNFINILRAAFTEVGPKNAKRHWRLTVFIANLGSSRVKAARKTLMKLSPKEEDGDSRPATPFSRPITAVVLQRKIHIINLKQYKKIYLSF